MRCPHCHGRATPGHDSGIDESLSTSVGIISCACNRLRLICCGIHSNDGFGDEIQCTLDVTMPETPTDPFDRLGEASTCLTIRLRRIGPAHADQLAELIPDRTSPSVYCSYDRTPHPDHLLVHPTGTRVHTARTGYLLRDPALSGGGLPTTHMAWRSVGGTTKSSTSATDHARTGPDGDQDWCPHAEGLFHRKRPRGSAAPCRRPALHGPPEIRTCPSRTRLAGHSRRDLIRPIALNRIIRQLFCELTPRHADGHLEPLPIIRVRMTAKAPACQVLRPVCFDEHDVKIPNMASIAPLQLFNWSVRPRANTIATSNFCDGGRVRTVAYAPPATAGTQ